MDEPLQWRNAEDEFGQVLAALYAAIINNLSNAKAALAPFEPVLLNLYTNYDANKIRRLGLLGAELAEKVDPLGRDEVTADVECFCDDLALIAPHSTYVTVVDLLLRVRQVVHGSYAPES